MDIKRFLIIVIVVFGLLLSFSVGLSTARDLQNNPPPVYPESAGESVSQMIPVQGRLTYASGVPVNGDFNITLRVFDQLTGGFVLCESTNLVHIEKGLFNTTLEGCSTADIDGKQAYLSIEVENDGEMTPRRPLYAVPYAYSLVNGAILRGSIVGKPMLTIANSANDGIALKADGRIQSTAPTYLFLPGSAIIKNKPSDETEIEILSSAARIKNGLSTAGGQILQLPISIPGELYGQRIRVTEIRIYYVCESSSNFIDYTTLSKQTGAATADWLINIGTNHNSTTATSYAPAIDTSKNTLSEDSGPLTLQLNLYFNDPSKYIQIGMVRLTLDHN